MATPQALHHSLLRPCILHILRAAGYHSTRPSVLDTLTDLAARYMYMLAQSAVNHAAINQGEPEIAMEITIQDVRMAMQDCGVFGPEILQEDQDIDDEEDTHGVDEFIKWATGLENREIRRIALEGGDDSKEDYLTALKKKHSTTDEESRYTGTVLGKPAEPRKIKIEGGESHPTSLAEWVEKMKNSDRSQSSAITSRRPSSDLSSLGDGTIDHMEF